LVWKQDKNHREIVIMKQRKIREDRVFTDQLIRWLKEINFVDGKKHNAELDTGYDTYLYVRGSESVEIKLNWHLRYELYTPFQATFSVGGQTTIMKDSFTHKTFTEILSRL